MIDESTRDKNCRNKFSQKAYVDEERGAVPSPIIPGDQALLKNTKDTGKLAPNFDPEPYTVLTKEGGQVTVKSMEGMVYRRDSSFCKPYISPDEAELPAEDTKIKDTDNSDPKPVEAEYSRPRRSTKPPERFKAYVLGKP